MSLVSNSHLPYVKPMLSLMTRLDGHLSRAPVSRFGISGNSNVTVRRVKLLTLKLILLASEPLFGYSKDWLAQCQDNVTNWVMMQMV